MRDQPTGEQLLETARTLLREELLPALPAGKKHEALMIANAMSIAMRQLQNGEAEEHKEIESLYRLLDGQTEAEKRAAASNPRELLKMLNHELCQRIRAGETDAGPWSEAALAHLRAVIRVKVQESNPKYLAEQAG